MAVFNTKNDLETEAVGASLGEYIKSKSGKGTFIAIYGDLGAGKTVFTRGFASVLSPGSRVKSPTYTIVNEYLKGKLPLYHFDFYRISDITELDGIGFDEYLYGGICIGEWCERLGEAIPAEAIKVSIEKTGDESRHINVDCPGFGEEK